MTVNYIYCYVFVTTKVPCAKYLIQYAFQFPLLYKSITNYFQFNIGSIS